MSTREPTPSVDSCRRQLIAACSTVYGAHREEMSMEGQGFFLWSGQNSVGVGIQIAYCPPNSVSTPPRQMPKSDLTVSFFPPNDNTRDTPIRMFTISRGRPEVIKHEAFAEGMGELSAPSTAAVALALRGMCTDLEAV